MEGAIGPFTTGLASSRVADGTMHFIKEPKRI